MPLPGHQARAATRQRQALLNLRERLANGGELDAALDTVEWLFELGANERFELLRVMESGEAAKG